MGIKYGDFEFPSSFGFSTSSGEKKPVKGYMRGGNIKKYATGGHVTIAGNVGQEGGKKFLKGGGHSTEGMASKMTRNNHITPVSMHAEKAHVAKFATGGAVDMKTDKKMIKTAVHKHEHAKHPGSPLTALKKGGYTGMKHGGKMHKKTGGHCA